MAETRFSRGEVAPGAQHRPSRNYEEDDQARLRMRERGAMVYPLPFCRMGGWPDDSLQQIAKIQEQLNIEYKMKAGAENMLKVSEFSQKGATISRDLVAAQLEQTNKNIAALTKQLDMYRNIRESAPKSKGSPDNIDLGSPRARTSVTNMMRDRKESSQSHTKSKRSEHAFTPNIAQTLADVLMRMRNPAEIPQARLECMSYLLKITRSVGEWETHVPMHEVMKSLRVCLVDPAKEMRANGFRTLRHMVINSTIAQAMFDAHIDIFIVRALTRDQRFDVEREQALKLVRGLIDIRGGVELLPQSVIRTIVAITEQPDDKFRGVCVETICEYGIRNLKLAAFAGGTRTIFSALLEGSKDLQELLVKTVLFILDTDWTRQYMRPSVELEMIISQFTDAYTRGPSQEEKLAPCAKALVSLLKSWTGLIYLCLEDKRGIKSIVDAFRLPFDENRDQNLSSLSVDRMNLIDHFLTVALLAFVDSGLLEALIEVIQEGETPFTTRATIFIASNFRDEASRHTATLALSHIDNLHKHKEKVLLGALEDSPANRRWLNRRYPALGNRHSRPMRHMEDVKIKMGIHIDDLHFRNLLAELEKVLAGKDFTKWNWDTIMELIQGPLLNPRRLDEVLKSTRIVKRLFSFYRPLNHQFSDLRKGKGSAKYIDAGVELLRTMLATMEGVRYLAEDKLIPEIAECLGHLDPMYGSQVSELVFSKDRMEKTLTCEYFTLLGLMSKYPDGVRLLERFKIFNLYYRLSELRSRDDLIKAMVTTMDYTKDGHPRIMLSKIMTSGYKHVRLYATNHLRYLLRKGVEDFSDWGVQLLVTQLYDPAPEVCEKAITVLDLACNDKRNLESKSLTIKVHMKMLAAQSGKDKALNGDAFGNRFLSTAVGFRHLQQWGYVEREMDYWFESGNIHYVTRLELSLARALSARTQKSRSFVEGVRLSDEASEPDVQEMDGTVLPHFYGELTKTEDGCELLHRKGHFSSFADYIRRRGLNVLDYSSILQLKSVLWAVGNIGSTSMGLPLLVQEDIIRNIINVAENSPVLTLRGTAVHVLGLICRTPEGMEILEEYGWESVSPPHGQLEGLCIPKDPSRLFRIDGWEFKGSWPKRRMRPRELPENFDAQELEILKCIGNMSNHIVANAASKTLSRLRHEHPSCFTKVELYIEVLRMISVYHYRLTARRFIQELFDRVVLNEAALEKIDSMNGLRFDDLNDVEDEDEEELSDSEDGGMDENDWDKEDEARGGGGDG
ncbi:hypothetical protein HK104_010434, partial [Borealophlyctis nickersoniae]